MWFLLSPLRPLFCRLTVEGRDNIPDDGGAVLASNHTVGPDYVLLAISSPRELHFMAKAEIFDWSPVLSTILRMGGVFPVRRGQGDKSALGNAVLTARRGNIVAMFPEGTRSRTGALMRGRTGAARIALAAEVPVIPAAVVNATAIFKRRSLRRPLVTVRFGEPIHWEADESDFLSATEYTEAVMGSIAELLPPEQRGFYGESVGEEEPMAQAVKTL